MWRGSLSRQLRRIATGSRISLKSRDARSDMAGYSAWRWLGGPATTKIDHSAGTGRDERMRRVESILFLARDPLASRKLSRYANLADATEARTLVRRLNELYDKNGRAFRIEEIAGGFQLLTRPKFSGWLRRLKHLPCELRLSAPAMETLAVVAYRQPIPRAEIEAIRGVSCGEILRQLMERDLVRIQGRSEELGRPYLYATTKRFLQAFGIKNLDKLPRADQLRGGGPEKAERAAPGQDVSRETDTTVCEREEESAVTTDELSREGIEELKSAAPVSDASNSFDQDIEDDFDEEEDFDDFDDDEDEDEDDFDEEEDEDLDAFEDDEEWEEVEDDDEEDEDDDEWDDEEEDWGEDDDEEEEVDWE